MKGVLITRKMTPKHEVAIVREEISYGRARIADNSEGLILNIQELHQV